MLPLQAELSRIQTICCSPTLSLTARETGYFAEYVYRENSPHHIYKQGAATLQTLFACREACSEESPRPAVGEKYPDLK